MRSQILVTLFWLYALLAVVASAFFAALIWRQPAPLDRKQTSARPISEMASRLPPD